METVKMSAEEMAQFEEFKKEQERKRRETEVREGREAYKKLVDETVTAVFPRLLDLSAVLAKEKAGVYDAFDKAMELKYEVFGVREGQRSHTHTTVDGKYRITLGYNETDAYDDTVNNGIEKVRKFIESLARDRESQMLVGAILKLLSTNAKTGTLKASRVMQLRRMADESRNGEFIDGVRIIEEAYRPVLSKQYVRAEMRNEKNEWVNVPLGMTES
jgi:hypothetical protein